MTKPPTKFIFQVTVFLSSFLLFTIEPMIGKRLLPLYGGGSSVWTTTMLFFMTTLFIGYLYSTLLIRLSIKKQITIHLSFLIATLLFTIFSFKIPLQANLEHPTLSIISSLLLRFGPQFLLLASTSSLLQYWYSLKEKSPYYLYAISNFGALLSLFSYPFLIEPFLSLSVQFVIWIALFVIYALLIYSTTKYLEKTEKPTFHLDFLSNFPKIRTLLIWVLLSLLTNALLLATTDDLTLRIASIPFLWIAPLALYLASFIIPFGMKNWSEKSFPSWITFISSSIYFYIVLNYPRLYFVPKIILELVILFIFSLVLNSNLYLTRPKSKYLAIYYLMIALGGLLGGIFVAILAPNYFPNLWELPLTYLTCILLILVLILKKQQNLFKKLIYILLSIGAIFCLHSTYKALLTKNPNKIASHRNFYGIVSVIQNKLTGSTSTLELYNGSIMHGMQITSPGGENVPTTYYGSESGVGQAILSHVNYNKPRSMRIGVIGLGAGTIAAYCQDGDYIRFYEINPVVIDYANKYFSYISRCQNRGGKVDIVEGDARIKLNEELNDGKKQLFDILVVDAFSDDAIPPHLLTREALDLYMDHLSNQGIIAFHITNRYMNLFPLIDAMALEKNLVVHKSENDVSSWAIVTANSSNSKLPFFIPKANKHMKPWTDDYSNLFQIINKW